MLRNQSDKIRSGVERGDTSHRAMRCDNFRAWTKENKNGSIVSRSHWSAEPLRQNAQVRAGMASHVSIGNRWMAQAPFVDGIVGREQ